jgi:uncharacterized protein YbjT (DUF2867 family)
MEERISLVTVTGSSGTIGTEVVTLLSAAGAPTRAVLRDPHKARPLPHVAWLQADLRDAALLDPALAGTKRLFLLTGNDPGFGRTQIGIVRAAEELGVGHLVKASALGASDHSKSWIGREHWEVEQAIQRSGMQWTMLRPHAFMQNWLGDLAESVKTEGVIYSPIGDGRVPFIDTRDIAAVAAEVLLHPEAHVGKKYVLTGGEAVGYADLAAALTTVTGRTISYRPISMDEARARMVARGASQESVDAVLAIAAYQKEGGPTATVSPTVQRLLGRPPRSLRDFVRDYAERFSVS